MREQEAQALAFPQRREPSIDGNLALQTEATTVDRPRLRLVDSRPADDIAQINRLQQVWDRTLGTPSPKDGKFRQYNPVLARWKFEQMQTDEERQQFREYELLNVTTALRERNNTSESRLTLMIDEDRKIRNELLPDEPFDTVLERGYEYRKSHGSKELERERAEINGFQTIQKVLTAEETAIGTTFLVISPPSEVEGSQYVHNFVDFYTLAEDATTGKRKIDYVRYPSPLSIDAYKKIASNINPNYFEGQQGANDAWFLGHPIQVPAVPQQSAEEVFEKLFAKDVKAMEEAAFQELYKTYLPFIHYYLDQITAAHFDPEKIAIAYNAILNSTEVKNIKETPKANTVFVSREYQQRVVFQGEDIGAVVDRYGRQPVKDLSTGCGTSGGFSVRGEATMPFANSVARFGVGGEVYTGERAKDDPSLCRCRGQEPHFHCPGESGNCGHPIIVGKGTSTCPECGAGKVC